jgi:hypothetical protein
MPGVRQQRAVQRIRSSKSATPALRLARVYRRGEGLPGAQPAAMSRAKAAPALDLQQLETAPPAARHARHSRRGLALPACTLRSSPRR